ncbi:hypothetical protein VT03_02445 [Planctomyces sp. SH-PL14]|nr:hypothetical protein VT03_02445 [Planctomyces sp. SH-PL14]
MLPPSACGIATERDLGCVWCCAVRTDFGRTEPVHPIGPEAPAARPA